MTNAEFERKIFWGMYEKFLDKNGKPFYFTARENYAVINKKTPAFNKPIIAMDFLVQKKLLRINAFMQDDEELFQHLFKIKKEIEEKLGFEVKWVHGEKGQNTYRIMIELHFSLLSEDEYNILIQKSIPIVEKFIYTFRPYIEC